ncbi:MAG: hypothetical protein ACYCPR_06370 [Thermoplasmataceae archaeon]|jgi:hypothetical protein
MEERDRTKKESDTVDKNGPGYDFKDAGLNIRENRKSEKMSLIMSILQLRSENAGLSMELIELQDSVRREIMRLSGLISILNIGDKAEIPVDITENFEVMFDKYLKKS